MIRSTFLDGGTPSQQNGVRGGQEVAEDSPLCLTIEGSSATERERFARSLLPILETMGKNIAFYNGNSPVERFGRPQGDYAWIVINQPGITNHKE